MSMVHDQQEEAFEGAVFQFRISSAALCEHCHCELVVHVDGKCVSCGKEHQPQGVNYEP